MYTRYGLELPRCNLRQAATCSRDSVKTTVVHCPREGLCQVDATNCCTVLYMAAPTAASGCSTVRFLSRTSTPELVPVVQALPTNCPRVCIAFLCIAGLDFATMNTMHFLQLTPSQLSQSE